MTTKPSSAFQRAKALIKRKLEERKKMLDERYRDMPEYEESDAERFERISNDPSAWTDMT